MCEKCKVCVRKKGKVEMTLFGNLVKVVFV